MTPAEFYAMIGRERVRDVVLASSTPAYLWFRSVIEAQVVRLKECLPKFHLHYAMKANPHPAVLRLMSDLELGVDVASGNELRSALAAGVAPNDVEFSGPGKTAAELALAVDCAIGSVNVESLPELALLCEIAAQRRARVRVGLRVNPAIRARTGLRMAGATQFGMSENDVAPALEIIGRSPVAEFVGLHVHVGSQVLDSDALLEIYRTCLDLARSTAERTGAPLGKLNFGGGWGVTYFEGQRPLDLAAVSSGIRVLIDDPAYAFALSGTRLIAEPGRYLVAESGLYVTRVLYRKQSGDRQFAIVDGGMHNNYLLAGGMGQVIRRNFQLDVLMDVAAREIRNTRLTIAGCLCTPQDVLAQNIERETDILPGDRVLFFNCGAYGATASPLGFLSHPSPTEALIDA